MNKKRHFLLSAVLATTLAANAQVTINVDASNPGVKVSPNLYGIFFEDINHAADGGLYAELISNRSFEDDDKNIPTWKTSAQEGAKVNAQQGFAQQGTGQGSPAYHCGKTSCHSLSHQRRLLGYQRRSGQNLQALFLGKG